MSKDLQRNVSGELICDIDIGGLDRTVKRNRTVKRIKGTKYHTVGKDLEAAGGDVRHGLKQTAVDHRRSYP